jgi:ADP-heptose:LPS heptosyltransferase
MRPVNKILFVTLTNTGDVILTLPALDLLRQLYPGARISVVSGPRAAELFICNPAIAQFLPYDKHMRFSDKLRFFWRLRAEKFDLAVDFRNSLFGLLGNRTARFVATQEGSHASQSHLARVRQLAKNAATASVKRGSLFISDPDKEYIELMLNRNGFTGTRKPVVISPGARSGIKRWPKERFCSLAQELLKKTGSAVILVGDAGDKDVTGYIARNVAGVIDLTGKTTLPQLAWLFSRSAVLITNDSANLHLAGYVDLPTVAIFGPTDERRYGPWSSRSAVVKKDLACRPCKQARCPYDTMECMAAINAEDVISVIQDISG